MRSSTSARALASLAGWLALLAVAIWVLTALGRGPLGVPSILDPGAWPEWLASTGPVTAAFALLRVATLAVAWYLAGATLIGAGARILDNARLIAAADVVTIPAVRPILQAAFGAGLAAASLSAGSTVALPDQPEPAVAAAAVPAATLEATPVEDTVVVTPPSPAPPALQPAPPAVRPAPVRPAPARDVWTVQPGDHLWSIAERVLARASSETPTEEKTARYWQRLVNANRSRLDDPGNPDLIRPGQRFELPPVDEA